MSKLLVVVLAAALVNGGCSSPNATYFRQYGTTQQDERIAWGLCGGNFFANGALRPIASPEVMDCMEAKGFYSINAYYEETFVAWTSETSPENVFWSQSDLLQCGAKANKHSVCKHYVYILKSDFDSVTACMKKKGFVPAVPRYKVGVRIFRDQKVIDPGYCLYYTPKNKQGSVSLGSWRFEP